MISHTEIGSGGVADITFNSNGLWSNYTDLLLKFSTRSAAAGTGGFDLSMQLNSSSSNYVGRRLYGNGSAVGSDLSASNKWSIGLGATSSGMTANTFANGQIYFCNINSTSVAKSIATEVVLETNAINSVQLIFAGLWNDTSAITSISINGEGSNIVQYSSFTLYGITKGSSGGVTVS